MPLTSVTLMTPASATWPDALTMPSLETLPFAMPIETVAPLPHSELDEAMRTFQRPAEDDAAAAGVASWVARSAAVLVAITTLRKLIMASPCCLVPPVVAYRL